MDFAPGEGLGGAEARWWITKEPASKSGQDVNGASLPATSLFTMEHAVLAEIAANMSSGFLLLNQRERIAYSNAHAERLLGIGGPALLDRPVFDFCQRLITLAVDPERARTDLDRLCDHPEEDRTADLALVDAAIRWLRVRSFPIHDDRGLLLGRGFLLDDVTLERDSTRARGEILTQAAHELKTPLAVIKGCATTLLGSSTRWDPNLQREMLQMIDTQADRLHDILNTLLDVWRLDAGTLHLHLALGQPLDLLRSLVERWQQQAPRHRFLLQAPPDLPALFYDPLRLEQAFTHLLANATTYASGGVVKIRLEANDLELRVSVSDEGIGIASDQLERVFERFYRGQQYTTAEGSGLGLAMVRSTIEAHGGKIWADSPGPGHGATFYFTLPLPQSASSGTVIPGLQTTEPLPPLTAKLPAISARTTGALRQGKHPRILIAESDARIARYLRANFEEQHYVVQVVNHGVQFLRQLDLEEPALILLANLADMSCLELLQRLRTFSQVPVIVLAEAVDEEADVQLLDLGADDLVHKPFSLKELLARARIQLRRQAAASSEQSKPTSAIFKSGDLLIDHAQHQVFIGERPVQLSRTEYKLLAALAQNAGMVMTHELLLEKVWGPEYNREVDFIWVYISRLRRKVEADPRRPRYIVTVPDVGYKLAKL